MQSVMSKDRAGKNNDSGLQRPQKYKTGPCLSARIQRCENMICNFNKSPEAVRSPMNCVLNGEICMQKTGHLYTTDTKLGEKSVNMSSKMDSTSVSGVLYPHVMF